MNYTDINAETVDRWVDDNWIWGIPISHEEFLRAKAGDWKMVLTPTKPVPGWWYPELRDARVLGLASGGGQQMPVFAALGAECTVLDYSQKQLDSEKMVAEREGYKIKIVCADMTKPLPFEDESFDLIFHPVSNCYIEEVEPVWHECFRILKKCGRLMAGVDNGLNYLYDDNETELKFTLPFNPLKDPGQMDALRRDDCGVQFSHTIGEQIGGQLRAGFTLLDVYDDTNGEGILHEHGAPSFWATLAEKR